MKDKQVKLNQIIQNFYTKAAQVVVQSRVAVSPVYTRGSLHPKINKWFNLELEETDTYREELKLWRNIDSFELPPPPLVIETYLDARNLNAHQQLVLETEDGQSHSVFDGMAPSEVVIERWIVEFNRDDTLDQDLPVIYKKCIVLFRALYTHCRLLPCWNVKKRFRSKLNISPVAVGCRVLNGSYPISSKGRIGLTKPIVSGTGGGHLETFTFGSVLTPIGSLRVSVSYRINNDFKVRDSESLFSQYLDERRPPSVQPFKSPSLSASPGTQRGTSVKKQTPVVMPSRYSSSFGQRNNPSSVPSSVGSNNSEPGSGFYVDDDDVGNFVKMVDSTKLLKLHDEAAVEDPLAKFQQLRGNHAALSDSMQSSLYLPSSSSPHRPTTHTPLVPSRLSEEYKAADPNTNNMARTANTYSQPRRASASTSASKDDDDDDDDELLFAMSDMPE